MKNATKKTASTKKAAPKADAPKVEAAKPFTNAEGGPAVAAVEAPSPATEPKKNAAKKAADSC